MMINNVVQRHMVKQACRVAYSQTSTLRLASRHHDLSVGVVEVIAKHLTASSNNDFTDRRAFAGLVKKVKTIITVFKKAPESWSKFKNMLGLTSSGVGLVKEIDEKLGALLEKGKEKLAQVATDIVKESPTLTLLADVLEKLDSWKSLLGQVADKLPQRVQNTIARIKSGGQSLGDLFDEILSKSKVLKALSSPIKIYLFFQVWNWLTDFDFKVIIKGLLGTLGFTELFALMSGEGIEYTLTLILPSPFNNKLVRLVAEVGLASVTAGTITLIVYHLREKYGLPNANAVFTMLAEKWDVFQDMATDLVT